MIHVVCLKNRPEKRWHHEEKMTKKSSFKRNGINEEKRVGNDK